MVNNFPNISCVSLFADSKIRFHARLKKVSWQTKSHFSTNFRPSLRVRTRKIQMMSMKLFENARRQQLLPCSLLYKESGLLLLKGYLPYNMQPLHL